MPRGRSAHARLEEPLVNVRLDPVVWETLRDVAALQGRTPRELIVAIARSSLGIAIRVYLEEFHRHIGVASERDDSQR